MAWYKSTKHLIKTDGRLAHWSKIYGVGEIAPVSGIYLCQECGKEIAHNQDTKLPPQNHHQHPPGLGDVGWKLIVRSNTKGN